MNLPWHWLGRVDLPTVVKRMEASRLAILNGSAAEELLLCEHPPTITLGRSADEADVVASPEQLSAQGVEVHRVSRGGQVTYHGPGQLMIYPVVRLHGSLLGFLRTIAGSITSACSEYGVEAIFRRQPAGVWVGERKIAACGLHLHRRVVTHGFAFNVSSPPTVWNAIVACGLPPGSLVSLRELSSKSPTLEAVASQIGPRLAAALSQATTQNGRNS